MVQTLQFFKKRQNLDINNINFVAGENPIGVNNFGFPIFPEITDPAFVQTTWSGLDYKNQTTTDSYGMFHSWYFRNGVRKFRQTHVELVLEQKGNTFHSPILFTNFFAARPVIYDPRDPTQLTPIPIYDHFNIFPTQNMMDNNIHDELRSTDVLGATAILEGVNAIPPPIQYTAGGFQREHILNDLALPISLETRSTATQGNKLFSFHELASPLQFDFPDTFALPQGINFEAKAHLYCFRAEYPISANNDAAPQLVPIPSDDIISFSGFHEAI